MNVTFSDDWLCESEIRDFLHCSNIALDAMAKHLNMGTYQLIAMRDGRESITPKVAKHFGFEPHTVYRRKNA